MQSTHSYKIGTCFFCMKCMYCAKDLTITTCNCDKSIKPTTKNRTNEIKFSRNCFYLLNNSDQTYVKKIQESVIKFNYNVDLNKSFYYTLCSSCNGKTYREKKSFKIIMNMNQLQILYLLLLQPLYLQHLLLHLIIHQFLMRQRIYI